MSWGTGIDAWAERLIAAWNAGDMPRFRKTAAGLDDVFSDDAMDAHAGELFAAMGKALVSGIDTAVRALGLIDYGFGPQDTDGLDFARGRKEAASLLDSAGWRTVPYQLRDRAFFSSRVNDLRTLGEMKARVGAALQWAPGQPNGPVMDAQRFAKEMRGILINGGVRTADGPGVGTLRDIMATRRLELVWNVQTAMARGFAGMKAGMDPDMLDAVPGFLFTRVTPRRNPRPEAFWQSRWARACAMAGWRGCIAEPMMCLKTSPVLRALGSLGPFGNPFDPFDYNTGMGLTDLDRDACEAAGLLEHNETVEPVKVPDLDERMEEGVDGVKPELLDRLDLYFGDQVSVDGGKAVWRKASKPYLSAAEQGWESAATWLGGKFAGAADPDAATETLARGKTIADAAGRAVRFSQATLDHIPADRLADLANAELTVRDPNEVIIQDLQRGYIRAFDEAGKPRRYMTVWVAKEDMKETPAGEVRTYFLKDSATPIDKARKGTGRVTYRN
ncbi:MAG TPA: hypothetical protein PLG22_07225 [Kiritimatiellia bacterium]|nr:hypothetical protein [Kiritimatiellia bacterium]